MKEKEDIKISLQEEAANEGSIASRIIKSLNEGKEVNTSYVFIHNGASTQKLVNKQEKINKIMGRMLKENNNYDGTDYKIYRECPYSEKIPLGVINTETGLENRLTIIKTKYILVKE